MVFFTYFNCKNPIPPATQQINGNLVSISNIPTTTPSLVFPEGATINQRILPPQGYKRESVEPASFAYYLRNLPLKSDTTQVRFFNGAVKPNYGGYVAVIDLPIGEKDLHQCADAVMRLRADYLYAQERYDDIHFNFTNGFQVDYSKWRSGKRIKVQGNNTYWVEGNTASNTAEDFWKYLEMIFTYAGTHSLSKELKKVDISNMQIGDIFIQGGFPGHAVIVVDMVKDPSTGKQLFLLAQSYMPAQELHIVSNPNNKNISPWYELDFGEELLTPDWQFSSMDLKRFH